LAKNANSCHLVSKIPEDCNVSTWYSEADNFFAETLVYF